MQRNENAISLELQRPEASCGRGSGTVVESPRVTLEGETTSPGSLVPGEVLLGSLLTPQLRIITPIVVRFFEDHDRVVAEATELNEFGFGSNASEALRDIQRAIAQLYRSLEESVGRLGPDLQSTWSVLRTMVTKLEPSG
jgi:hypothetical protein